MRYELRKFETGWAVWDTTTDAPALVDGSFQDGMLMNDAKNLTDLLNQLDQEANVNSGR
jgi:hypothetical protein